MPKESNSESEFRIQVKPTNGGETECFAFELPKNQMKVKHLEAILDFMKFNEASHVLKSLLHIYFTARDDEFFEMNSEQRLCFEHILTLLADLSCEKIC